MTGIVGAAGGFGGFLLPSALGSIKDGTGTYGPGFALLALVAISGAGALLALGRVWRTRWNPESARRAGLAVRTTELEESRNSPVPSLY
jgi:NNP family nitrate/nitrite transporter-like MFS transporter